MNKINLAPTKRFSPKVQNYLKYRPHYPEEIITFFKNKNILSNDSVIADIGSGTGLLTEIFLKNGNIVYGVEPNKEMREAGEKYLKQFSNFISLDGTAEKTTLNKNSIDLITAGQAFHWFNVQKTKKEFSRILNPGGFVILIWNSKNKSSSFMKAYYKLLIQYGTDYDKVRHEAVGKEILSEFYNKKYNSKSFYNEQILDYKSFKGRFLSSSYIPLPFSPNYKKMLSDLKKIFETYQNDNKVIFEYETKVFWQNLV